jgi:hypothetical protein
MKPQRSDLVKVLYAVKSVFHAATAIRSASDHEATVKGLSFRHFAIGGVLAATLIALILFSLVKFATG